MENMKFKTTHYYIASVYTDDENTYEPTHCSIEIPPHNLWMIFKYLLTAWIIQMINREIQEVRFRFIETGGDSTEEKGFRIEDGKEEADRAKQDEDDGEVGSAVGVPAAAGDAPEGEASIE